MRHIVSRHLDTQDNSKLLGTAPTHITSSEETLPHLAHRSLPLLITNKSPVHKSDLHKVDANSHQSPL